MDSRLRGNDKALMDNLAIGIYPFAKIAILRYKQRYQWFQGGTAL